MLEVSRLVGDTQIKYQANGKDLKEEILMCSWLLQAPTVCGACGAVDIQLQGRSAKDFIFAEFRCNKCGAKTTMGEYKNPKGVLFVKNKKENWQVWGEGEPKE